MAHLTIFLTLLGLAALWPPYNIFIARALGQGDYLTAALTPVVSSVGLAIITAAMVAGASLVNLPLSLVGGIFVLLMGLRMLWKAPSHDAGLGTVEKAGMLGTVFLISLMPGVYSVTAAMGVQEGDYLLTALVFLAGPTLGITLGGVVLHHGFRATRLPLARVGGAVLAGIGLWMILS